MDVSVTTREELEAQIEALRARLARVEGTAEHTAEKIVGAAREVAHTYGTAARIDAIAKYAELNQSTLYRHFGSRQDIMRELVRQMVQEVWDDGLAVAARYSDPDADGRMMMIEWWDVGFRAVAKYGLLAVQVNFPDFTPRWLKDLVKQEETYRYTGAIVNRCKEQGHCRGDVPTRVIVRTFFSLVHPFRIRWCLSEGLTAEEIREETLLTFFRAYAADPEAIEAQMAEMQAPTSSKDS